MIFGILLILLFILIATQLIHKFGQTNLNWNDLEDDGYGCNEIKEEDNNE